MNVSQIDARIKFLRKERPHAPDGSQLAQTSWAYDLDGQTVCIVTDKYLMHDWDFDESQIIEAGRVFIKSKLQEKWVPSRESNRLVLDQHELTPISKSLGWSPASSKRDTKIDADSSN